MTHQRRDSPPGEASAKPPKPKPSRPRDEFGRPLPRGTGNRLELADFDSLSLPENHELAIRYWSAGRFFEAHEAWETCWNQARGGTDEDLFKGLAQLAAGYTHYRRGNGRGAAVLIARGLARIAAYPAGHRGLAISSLVAEASRQAREMSAASEAATSLPAVTVPSLT